MKPRILTIITAMLLGFVFQAEAGIFDLFGSKSPEDSLKEALTTQFNNKKQVLFNLFHPTGTAKKVEIHEVRIAWRNNKPSNNFNDMIGYGVRFTIFWQGPVTKDGFTKVLAVWDGEAQHWTHSEVISTNGITNADAGNFTLDFLKGFLDGK